jgi:hypothetical protein
MDLGDTIDLIRQAFESGNLTTLADSSRVDSYEHLLLAIVVVWLGLCLLARLTYLAFRPAKAARRGLREEKEPIVRATNTQLWRRWWWKLHPTADMMAVDGLVIDRTGKRSHALWPGPTGAGKSESVATVRCDGARPWLAVMPDVSDPLRRRADFIWTAGESSKAIDFLKGTPEEVAERLTTVFRSGGNGVWLMAAREATTQVVRVLDAARAPRSLEVIGDALEALIDNDKRLKTACENWVTRFRATAMAMGGSVASGGVDIGDLLRAGKGVVIDNDRWKHPGLCGDTVAFGLAEAKRVADLVPGGFRLIFEEADQLGERIDLADPFFAAGRRRHIAVDALVHAEEDADDAMATNSATRVYFRPNKPEQRAKVAKALDLSEAQVDGIPDYHAWIEHDGKVRRLVHFPKPKTVTPVTAGISSSEQVVQTGGLARVVVTEQPHWKGTGEPVEYGEWNGPRMLPPPGVKLQKLIDGSVREGGCLRWNRLLGIDPVTGKEKRPRHDKDGYGEIWIDGEGRYLKVHRLAWELVFGAIPRNPDGTTMTIDHLSGVCLHKDCFELTHLELVTREKNSKRRQTAAKVRPKASGGAGGKRVVTK